MLFRSGFAAYPDGVVDVLGGSRAPHHCAAVVGTGDWTFRFVFGGIEKAELWRGHLEHVGRLQLFDAECAARVGRVVILGDVAGVATEAKDLHEQTVVGGQLLFEFSRERELFQIIVVLFVLLTIYGYIIGGKK